MKNQIITIIIGLFVCTPAFAAKVHREAKKELTPKLAEGAKAIKENCGCAPKITVDWKALNKTKSNKTDDYKKNIAYEIEHASTMTKEFCSDAESKKLFCSNVKRVHIVPKGVSEADAKHDSRKKTMVIYTSEQMNSGGYKMKSLMEEW